LVESPQNLSKEKDCSPHTAFIFKEFWVSKVCIKNVKPKLCLYYIFNQRHIYMIKQHFKDIIL
jgi:hypothetical protein